MSALSGTMHRGRRRLESLLHSIDEGFVVFDRDWRYRYVNDRGAVLLRHPTPMIGKAIWELFPDIVGTDVGTRLRRASAEPAPIVFETLYRRYGRGVSARVFPAPHGRTVPLEATTA